MFVGSGRLELIRADIKADLVASVLRKTEDFLDFCASNALTLCPKAENSGLESRRGTNGPHPCLATLMVERAEPPCPVKSFSYSRYLACRTKSFDSSKVLTRRTGSLAAIYSCSSKNGLRSREKRCEKTDRGTLLWRRAARLLLLLGPPARSMSTHRLAPRRKDEKYEKTTRIATETENRTRSKKQVRHEGR